MDTKRPRVSGALSYHANVTTTLVSVEPRPSACDSTTT